MHPTLRYLSGRLLTTALVVVGAVTLLFALTLLVPGNPASVLLGPRATPEAVAALAERMGLDRPLHERLLMFFGQVATGNLGTDVISGRPILTMVMEVLPFTVTLTIAAIGLAVLVGVPLGCYAATNPGSRGDRVAAVLSVSFIAMPNFVVAIFLLLIFSIWLDWLPVLGAGEPGDVLDQLVRLILPSVSLALGWVGYIARLMRSSLLEVLGEPYIRTARAFGIPDRKIVYKYALKNAAIPTVAILGLGVGRLLGGAIFAEIIFARPGIGTLVYDAILTRNYPVVQAGVLVVVLLFVLTNLLVDLSYAWLDPRLRPQKGVA
ncbi:ABC transporter permease [Azospirillum sp. RWY-5-1]|uniref:ABC transporter permease n=1 Tax=Azospirillum oleiclasticum TaxID=2735135 RepID=A0ABX2T6F4_9PROT|nr:ABC transporter permease [Azospirillum oleiclasticum]NYZ11068.1 ABC transporter permease [Azospirillum oleiclasticum]NYZ18230.1 ABC transporter permease [Azospirillum oleiclasticum]